MLEPARTALSVIISELAPLDGRRLLDIGCGKGGMQGPLEKAGALWRGLDPLASPKDFPIDITSAEEMPYPDHSYDAAVCVNALHHVPVLAMDAALCEAARVLRPGGRLVVIEPKATGALSQVIAVVDDETEIRGAAQDAMDRTTALVQVAGYDYARTDRYAVFEGFCDILIAVDPARLAHVTARKAELRRIIEAQAGRNGEDWTCRSSGSSGYVSPPVGDVWRPNRRCLATAE